MGSVIATWRAATPDARVQSSLSEYVQKLGRHHQLRRAESAGLEVPAFSRMLTAQRSAGLPSVPDERFFQNQIIQGRVVVNSDLFPKSRAIADLPDEIRLAVGRPLPDRETAIADAETRGLRVIREDGIGYVVLEKATLFGVDFRMFDPRNLYPGSDRLSFVFPRDTGWPLLDGRMVSVDDSAACAIYRSEVLRSADWHLSLPFVHLRYFAEEWSDRLFAWMQRYFIFDLIYDRYEANTDFGLHDSRMAEMEQKLGVPEARERCFTNLLAEYDAELAAWKIDMASWVRPESDSSIGNESS
jgi:hypothetical protein